MGVKTCKKLLAISTIVIFSALVTLICVGCNPVATKTKKVEGVFEGYFQNDQPVTDKDVVFAKDSQIYKFSLKGGQVKNFKIENQADGVFKNPASVAVEEGAFEIQNRLIVGQLYHLEVQDNDTIIGITARERLQFSENGAVSYTPGQRTLKNFLQTSMAPIGTLMVYGGGWDFQDVGAADEARTIGVNPIWRDEFKNQTVDYDWFETYPQNGWNENHYRGLDNGGYTGWTLYNTMYDTSLDHPGLVFQPNELVKALTEKYAFGTNILESLKGMDATQIAQNLKPGDIIASPMHYRTVVGVCDDNSVVFMDCTTATSKTGATGGGVQLVAVNPNDDGNTNCEAYRLVEKYMSKLYPEWVERYNPRILENDVCFDLVAAVRMDLGSTGMFSDPDGYSTKTATAILADIVGEQ